MNPRLGTMIAVSSVMMAVGSDAYALGGFNASTTTKLMLNIADTTDTTDIETVGSDAYALGGHNASSTTKLMLNTTDSSESVNNTFSTDGLSLSGVVLQTSTQDRSQAE